MPKILKDGSGNFLTSKSGDLFSTTAGDQGVILNLPFSLQIVGQDVTFITSAVPENAVYFHLEFNGFISGTYTSHRIKFSATGNGYIGTKAEVFGPYATNTYNEANLVVEFLDGTIVPVLRTIVSPLPPEMLSITAVTGTNPGEIVITVASIPDGGDGPVYGDNLGTSDFIDINLNNENWTSLSALSVGSYVYNTGSPGVTYSLTARARSAYRAGPASSPITVSSKENPAAGTPPVDLGLMTPLTLTAGQAWSVDLDDYVSGATRFVIQTGLTGGSYNSGTHVYSVASLTQGSTTMSIKAYNGALDTDPSIIVLWDVAVGASVVRPTLVTPLPDIAVQTGDVVSVDLASYFSGSAFTISISPSSNATFGLGTGGEINYFKNKVALNSTFASTNFTVTATNTGGSASDTFAVQVTQSRVPALTTGTQVRVKYSTNRFGDIYRAAVLDFPTGSDVISGKTVKPVWSTSTPDAEGIIDPSQYEYLQLTSNSPKEYQTQMDEPLDRGNPTDQTATINLGTNPFTVTSGSNEVVVTTPVDHGFFVGATTRYSGQTTFNGITIDAGTYYSVIQVVNSTSYKIIATMNATSSGSGGGSSVVLRPQRRDYSVFNLDEVRADKLRIALEVDGVVGYWSNVMSVPAVAPPATIEQWVYNSRRPYASYYNTTGADFTPRTDPYVGNEGKQFEHCIARNANRTPAVEDADLVLCGQDENAITWSDDFGRIFIPPLSFGLRAAGSTGGLYLETDCFSTNTDVVIAVGGYAWGTGTPGAYISSDRCKTFERVKIMDGTRACWTGTAAFTRTNQNWVNRRPQVISGALVSDVNRPWYILELTKGGGNTGTMTHCKLLRNNSATSYETLKDPTNWKVIYSWPVTGTNSVLSSGGTTTNEQDEAWLGVRVATNGDVAVYGTKGIEVSTNAGTAAVGSVTFNRVYSGWVTGLELDLTLNSSTISGAYCSVYFQGGTTESGVFKTTNLRTGSWSKPAFHGIPGSAGCNNLSVSPVNFDRVYVTTLGKRAATTGSQGYFSSTGGVGTGSGNTGFNPVTITKPYGYTDSKNGFKFNWGDRPTGIYAHFTKPTQALGAMQGGAWTVALNSTNFDGRITGFMDHSHNKGWGYNPNDVDKFGAMQQDGGPLIHHKGEAYSEFAGLRHSSSAVNQAGTTNTVYNHTLTVVTNGNAGRTGGKFFAPIPGNSNRYIAGFAPDQAHNQNVPVIFTVNPVGGDYTGTPVVRTDVGSSRGAKFFVHPDYLTNGTGTNTIIAGKWFITNYNAASPANIVFTDYNDYEVLGWSREGGTLNWLFGTSGNVGSTIYRSTNANGSGPVSWKTLSSNALKTACAVNPFQHQMLYYSLVSDDGKLRRITASTNQVIVDFLPLIQAEFTSRGFALENPNEVSIEHVVADLNVEGLVYACFNCQGQASIWRIRNAHATDLNTIIAEDITFNSTYTNSARVDVHPMTGEVLFSSSMGEYILPAPSWYPNVTYKNRHSDWLKAFYGFNGVPLPRTVTPLN